MKLVDIFKTKYFVVHWKKDLDAFLRALLNGEDIPHYQEALDTMRKNNDRVLDIADARLTQNNLDLLINNKPEGITIIDSKNDYRERVLREKDRRAANSVEKVPLPRLGDKEDVKTFIMNLDTNVIYTISGEYFEHYVGDGYKLRSLNLAVAVLTSLFNPDVKINLGNCTEDFFRHFNLNMNLEQNIYKDYKVWWVNTFVNATTLSNDMIEVDWDGVCTWEKFKNEYVYIPSIIGTKKLETKKEFEDFSQVINKAATAIAFVRTKEETLLDLLR